jgi:hypothetical protein
MIRIDADLPPAALVDQAGPAMARAVAEAGGLWLEAAAPHMEQDADGVVRLWHPRVGAGPARPAAPNKGQSRLTPRGLALEAGVNGGFALEGAVADAACLSFAVLYHAPQGDIRTLISVNPPGAKNYLFLYEQEGFLGLKDQANSAEILCPLPPAAGMRLAVGALADRRLYLRADAGPVLRAEAPGMEIAGPADLFIGCRSQRDGLLKTLGRGAIASVLLWPGRNLLAPEGAAQRAALDAWRFWDG